MREFERHDGLLRDLAGCFVDYRDPRYVEHSVQELLGQRIFGLVLGYEDLNDHDHLRRDPVHGLICGKSDPLGQERDKGKALAAHSTLNRLELSAQSIDQSYHKIQVQPEKAELLLIQRGVKAIPRTAKPNIKTRYSSVLIKICDSFRLTPWVAPAPSLLSQSSPRHRTAEA